MVFFAAAMKIFLLSRLLQTHPKTRPTHGFPSPWGGLGSPFLRPDPRGDPFEISRPTPWADPPMSERVWRSLLLSTAGVYFRDMSSPELIGRYFDAGAKEVKLKKSIRLLKRREALYTI
jgi:hypothetical protein